MNLVRNHVIAGTCAAIGLLAGTAAAQQPSEFSRPLAGNKAKVADGRGNAQTRIFTTDGDDKYEIVIANGEVSAKVNGKKIPAERIRRTKDKVEILDKDGEVLKSFDVASADGTQWRAIGRADQMDPNMPKPKVMIGITMSENEDGVIVERVYDDLPAAKAGLKVQDVIVEVDGTKVQDQKAFRELLNKKEAGDKVRLKVVRKGEDKNVTIELQKFDAEKFGMGGAQGGQGGWQQLPNWQGFEGFKMEGPEWEAMQEAMKNHQGGRTMVWGAGPDGQMQFMPFGGTDSKRLEEMQSQIDKKIADLDAKLERINEQMAKLEKLLTKLNEKGNSR